MWCNRAKARSNSLWTLGSQLVENATVPRVSGPPADSEDEHDAAATKRVPVMTIRVEALAPRRLTTNQPLMRRCYDDCRTVV